MRRRVATWLGVLLLIYGLTLVRVTATIDYPLNVGGSMVSWQPERGFPLVFLACLLITVLQASRRSARIAAWLYVIAVVVEVVWTVLEEGGESAFGSGGSLLAWLPIFLSLCGLYVSLAPAIMQRKPKEDERDR